MPTAVALAVRLEESAHGDGTNWGLHLSWFMDLHGSFKEAFMTQAWGQDRPTPPNNHKQEDCRPHVVCCVSFSALLAPKRSGV